MVADASTLTESAAQYGASGPDTARLLVSCPDRPGIVAAISSFLLESGSNIITSDQYSSDPEGGSFFLRMSFRRPGIFEHRGEFEASFLPIAKRFSMNWRFTYAAERPRVALMVSHYDHCLMDLLWRWKRAELPGQPTMVVSNHPDLADAVGTFDLPYYHVPVGGNKREAEDEALELMAGSDLIVLARYMQILSREFLDAAGCAVINIHHSFLPAFPGADPYARARARGVKLIGATAHYVTEDLDAGPIIEQDVLRVNHRYTPADLERVGRDLERIVLARAVRSQLENRVLVDGARTIVF